MIMPRCTNLFVIPSKAQLCAEPKIKYQINIINKENLQIFLGVAFFNTLYWSHLLPICDHCLQSMEKEFGDITELILTLRPIRAETRPVVSTAHPTAPSTHLKIP